jgi:hypothetical protein
LSAEQSEHAKLSVERAVARRALLRLLEPLAGFALDAGLSIPELNLILRTVAVRDLAAQQRESAERINISGIAASTGITRAEVSRILRSGAAFVERGAHRDQQPTNRVLEAWCQLRKFTTTQGRPADIKIYGRGATFETLVKYAGRGIPARAMLEELIRIGAVSLRSSQVLRLKSRVTVNRRMTPLAIKKFGDHGSRILSSMLQEARHAGGRTVLARASRTIETYNQHSPLRKKLSAMSDDFLTEIHRMISPGPKRIGGMLGSELAGQLSVHVCLRRAPAKSKRKRESRPKRTNYRRVR